MPGARQRDPRRETADHPGVFASIMPGYDHANQPLPEWAATWFEHWERGEDMTMFYGVRPDAEPAT